MKRSILAVAAATLLVSGLTVHAAQPRPSKAAPVVKGGKAGKSARPYFDDPAFDALRAALAELHFPNKAEEEMAWFDKLPQFSFSPATSRQLLQQFGTGPLFTAARMPSATGLHDVAINIPAVNRVRADGSAFSWEPMQARVTFDPAQDSVLLQASAPYLYFDNKDGRLDVRNVLINTTNRGPGVLAYGVSGGEVGKVTFVAKKLQQTVALEGLFVKMSLIDEGETAGIRYDSGVNTVEIMGERVDDIRLGMHLTSLDKTALEAFIVASQAMSKPAPPQGHDVTPMMRLLGKALMAQGAVFEFDDIGFSYHGMRAYVRGEMHLDNATEADLATGDSFAAKIVGHADVVMPLAMLHAFTDKIVQRELASRPFDAAASEHAREAGYEGGLSALLAENFFRIEGENLVATIDVRDGAVLVNGKPFEMPKPKKPVAAADSGSSRRAHPRKAPAN